MRPLFTDFVLVAFLSNSKFEEEGYDFFLVCGQILTNFNTTLFLYN